MRQSSPLLVCLSLTLALVLPEAALAQVNSQANVQPNPQPGPNAQTPLDAGYRDMYNLDFPAAHRHFAEWRGQHPADPLGAGSDAAAYLFSEFDRLHIIDVQLFADQSHFDSRKRLTPDPAVRSAFDQQVAEAEKLASAALTQNPRDANALYTKALLFGLRSDYAMMIDKHDLDALSYSKQSSALSQQVLAVDPRLYDAYLASGVENYMLSLQWAPMRWLLNWTGANTNREEGIRRLRLTATQGHYLAPFARMMLAVAAIRAGHPQEARDILTALSREYPHNSLYLYERDRIH